MVYIDYLKSPDKTLQGLGSYISSQITEPTVLVCHSLGYCLGKYTWQINKNIKYIINIDCDDVVYKNHESFTRDQLYKTSEQWKEIKYQT